RAHLQHRARVRGPSCARYWRRRARRAPLAQDVRKARRRTLRMAECSKQARHTRAGSARLNPSAAAESRRRVCRSPNDACLASARHPRGQEGGAQSRRQEALERTALRCHCTARNVRAPQAQSLHAGEREEAKRRRQALRRDRKERRRFHAHTDAGKRVAERVRKATAFCVANLATYPISRPRCLRGTIYPPRLLFVEIAKLRRHLVAGQTDEWPELRLES